MLAIYVRKGDRQSSVFLRRELIAQLELLKLLQLSYRSQRLICHPYRLETEASELGVMHEFG